MALYFRRISWDRTIRHVHTPKQTIALHLAEFRR